MSVSFWMDTANKEASNFDVIIIGGGIAGVSTAYWLAHEDSELNIALVEKHRIGDGATGRNAGFITCGSVEHFNRLLEKHGEKEALEIWNFSEENLKLLKEHIVQDNAEELFFEQKGSFSLASTESEFEELKKSANLMGKLDIKVEALTEKDIQERLMATKFIGGIKYCDDASVHPLKLLQQIKAKAEKKSKKIKFFENSEVYSIENGVDGNKLVCTRGHKLEAPIVVFATNGYSSLLNPFFKDKIFPTRGQILTTAPVPKFMEGPCYANFVLDYFRQLPTGELIIGGFRQLQKDAEIGYSDETSGVIQNALEEFIQKHIAKAASAKITHRWSGIMGFSIDGQPMIGSLPTDSQLFFLGGFTAHGLGLAFHSAKVLVNSIFGRKIPNFISAKRL